MEYRGLYVSATPDCEPNEGGYYCQVYADEDYGDQIDDFCIHPDELEEGICLRRISVSGGQIPAVIVRFFEKIFGL